jgi:hypothetical protein
MQNLLPPLKTDYVLEKTKQRIEWKPFEADPTKGKIPLSLNYLNKKEIEETYETAINKLPLPEPNIRLISSNVLSEMENSPLSISERGIDELPIISFSITKNRQQDILVKSISKSPIENNNSGVKKNYNLVLNMINDLSVEMDLYYQRVSSINNIIVFPQSNCLR